ncbi:Aminopeptidase [Aphelenchoides besseyi]|nr:Aminopeptidase [Aphelenchoides besseyi]
MNTMPSPANPPPLVYDVAANELPEPPEDEWPSARSVRSEQCEPLNRTEPPNILRTKKRRRCAVCAICILGLAMLIYGAVIGYIIFVKLSNRCSNGELLMSVDNDLTSTQRINAECGVQFPWKKIRLPTDLVPIRYNLFIHPNLTTFDFNGSVDIDIRVNNKTRLLILHQQALNLSSYSLYVDGQSVSSRIATCERLNQWAFTLDQNLQPGQKVRIHLDYNARIGRTMLAGFYANRHVDHELETETYSAVSQFEATFARRALPCFDEPNFKAVFDLSIVREKSHVTRANMNLIRTKPYGSDYVMDQFAPTPKMSTYILAFAVLDGFNKARQMTKKTKRPIEVNVFSATRDYRQQSQFALDTAIRALEYFEDFFDIPFPLQKTDLLALDDFAEGAMENWGLMTFRDVLLLYDDKSTEKMLEQAALVVAHEVAHQWFGNYVTMEWWNDLWLNEGFANYMEFLCVSNLFPNWNVMADFFVENTINSFMADGFLSSHPISTDTDNQDPMQISSQFDVISYNKGAAVLQMIRGLTGAERFKMALRTYLKKYAYANARGEDLWNVIQGNTLLTVDLKFTDVAKAWTTKVGYPMVTASLSEDGTKMILHNQTRFLYLEESRNVTDVWPIPIQFRTSTVSIPRLVWLLNETEIVDIGSEPSKWIIANAESEGFYRVLYSRPIYAEFTRQFNLNPKAISVIDRASVLNDAFAYLKSGYLSVDVVFDLIAYCADGQETDRTPWIVVMSGMKHIENILANEAGLLKMLEKYERHLILKTYEQTSWDRPTTHAERILQVEVLTFACRLDVLDCSKLAQQKFHQWLRNRTACHIDLLPLVLEAGIKSGTVEDWEQVFQLYMKSHSPSEKQMFLTSLTVTKDVNLINKLLIMCLNNKIIRPNILPRVIGHLMTNRAASFAVWHFCRQNFVRIEKALGDSANLLGGLLKNVIENFSTQFDLDEVMRHFGKLDMGATRSRFDSAIDTVKLNIQWRRLNEKPLELWLKTWHAAHGTD